MQYFIKDKKQVCCFLAAILCLLGGISIYILFRTTTLRIFGWTEWLVGDDLLFSAREYVSRLNLTGFMIYSLPDGLYCLSYILFMDALWRRNNPLWKTSFVALIPMIAISHEALQGLGIAKGTFDWFDLFAYALPLLFYFSMVIRKKLKHKFKYKHNFNSLISY